MKARAGIALTMTSARGALAAFLAGFGVLSAVVGTIGALFPDAFRTQGWVYLGVLLLVAVVWAGWRAFPRMSYERHFAVPNTTIRLIVGDLFEQDGHLVIGTCDTFDTEIPNVIATTSVQGQMLLREYAGDLKRLDCDLDETLSNYAATQVESARDKPKGKLSRYPIGTVAVLGNAQRRLLCVAYTKMGNDCVARSTGSDLWSALALLWRTTRDVVHAQPVSMAIVGSDLAKLSSQFSKEDLVRLIALSFLAASREERVTSCLQIVIRPVDVPHLDLRALANVLYEF
jgi:hypothetical protein